MKMRKTLVEENEKGKTVGEQLDKRKEIAEETLGNGGRGRVEARLRKKRIRQ